jgi:ABC-type arginine transport system permease subunit
VACRRVSRKPPSPSASGRAWRRGWSCCRRRCGSSSQYLNLIKNSSLAVAVGYADLVAVGGTILNQSGKSIEIIAIWMLIYVSISLVTSMFMNWFNAKMALVER